MDNKVSVDGLTFVPYLTSAEIDREVKRVASELREDLKGKNPLFLCVLNGAFIFAADLFREVGLNNARINFVKYSSYEGTSSTGKVKEIMGLTEDIEGMDVVIVEDIVDTGNTMYRLLEDLSIHDGIGPEKTQPSVDTLRNAASQAGKFENRLRSRLCGVLHSAEIHYRIRP